MTVGIGSRGTAPFGSDRERQPNAYSQPDLASTLSFEILTTT
jgi:hypothetical protein